LTIDYATYLAMFLFFIWLWAMRGPFAVGTGDRAGRQAALIGAVARVARG